MQVTSGSEWETDKGNKRSFGVAYDLNDLRHAKGDEYVDGLTNAQRYAELIKGAEKMVVGYLYSEGVVTREYLAERMKELNG